MKRKIEIEQAENGFSVKVWKKDDEKEDYGYYGESETYVATDEEELVKVIKDNLK